jgi:myo-inositol-1(or 4)-monophosphatase
VTFDLRSPADLDRLLAIGRAVVAEAAALLAAVRPDHIHSKSNPRDLVTEWDLRSEQLIRARLAAATPSIPVVGEETGGDPSVAYYWLVDPIDGTVNFAHGLPLWTVALALVGPEGVAVGVVTAPALGWSFWGRRGGGSFARRGGSDERLRVSAMDRLDRAMLVSGFPYDLATARDNNFAEWNHFQRVAGACRRLGSASLDLCLVAAGAIDGYWERRLSAWDVAAGALLVQEAGGVVTDTRGGRFDPASGEAVAAGSGIHEAIVRELAIVAA